MCNLGRERSSRRRGPGDAEVPEEHGTRLRKRRTDLSFEGKEVADRLVHTDTVENLGEGRARVERRAPGEAGRSTDAQLGQNTWNIDGRYNFHGHPAMTSPLMVTGAGTIARHLTTVGP